MICRGGSTFECIFRSPLAVGDWNQKPRANIGGRVVLVCVRGIESVTLYYNS